MLLIEWFSFVFGKFLEIQKYFIISNTILKYILLLNLYESIWKILLILTTLVYVFVYPIQ